MSGNSERSITIRRVVGPYPYYSWGKPCVNCEVRGSGWSLCQSVVSRFSSGSPARLRQGRPALQQHPPERTRLGRLRSIPVPVDETAFDQRRVGVIVVYSAVEDRKVIAAERPRSGGRSSWKNSAIRSPQKHSGHSWPSARKGQPPSEFRAGPASGSVPTSIACAGSPPAYQAPQIRPSAHFSAHSGDLILADSGFLASLGRLELVSVGLSHGGGVDEPGYA
jgi:hypothetical protein